MRKGKTFLNIATNKLYTWFCKHVNLVLLIFLLAVVYWKWWVGGVRVATDYPLVSTNTLKSMLDVPRTWQFNGAVGLGEYTIFTSWFWPMNFTAGALSNLGLTFSILERVMYIIPVLVIGVYGIWNLIREFGLSKTSRFVASFFYLTTTYVLLLIDGGQLSIALAYAWFPVAYLLLIRSVRGRVESKVLAGTSLWILGFFDIRFVYVLGVLLLLYFVYSLVSFDRKTWLSYISGWITSGIIAGGLFLALNAYWILPLLKFPISNAVFSSLTKDSGLDFTQFKNSVSLLQPHWYENIFGKIPPFRKEFLLIPILAFLAPILNRKDKHVWFWTIVAIISVFLAKGANPPLSGIYPWLFSHVPGFSLFRDSTKFFLLVALSYSVLIASIVDELTKKFSKFKFAFPILVILYLLFLIHPIYLGQMTGTFSDPRYETEYFSLISKLESDNNFGRVFWIPSRTPLSFSSPIHPAVEASRLQSLRPFEIATVGSYETQNFIREGSYMGELFDIVGIKYVAYPYLDLKRDDISQERVDYYNTFLGQIENLSWIDSKVSDFPVPVFKTKRSEDKFFLSGSIYFIVGSDNIYRDIFLLGTKFSDNALVFAEENPGLLNQIEKIPEAKVILYGKDLADLLLSFVNEDKFIFPGTNLDASPNQTGWWKRGTGDFVWWRDFLQQKYGIENSDFDYGGGWAVAEQNKILNIKNEKFKTESILYARVMKSSRGGTIEFWQGGAKIGEINTLISKPEKVEIKLTGSGSTPDKYFEYDKAVFSWFRIGDLVSGGEVDIKTQGDINVVNSLAVISQEEEKSLLAEGDLLKNAGKIIDWNKLDASGKKNLFSSKNRATVSYTALSSTHYKIKISEITAESTLFFSETYNSDWELDSQSSYPLYSLINGFTVTKDGEYDLYFTPQNYVIPGLVVGGATLLISVLALIKFRKRL